MRPLLTMTTPRLCRGRAVDALFLAPVIALATLALTTVTARTAAADEPVAPPLVVIDPPVPDPPPVAAPAGLRYVEVAPDPHELPDAHMPTPVTRSESVWYGGQTLGVDAIALGAFVAGAASLGGSTQSAQTVATTLLVTSGITYALGGPLVHVAHARYKTAAADLALRVGAPLVLGGTGALLGGLALSNNNGGDAWSTAIGGVLGGVIGLGAGVITASIVDSVSFARQPITKQVETGLSWAPVAAPVRGGATAGLVGRF